MAMGQFNLEAEWKYRTGTLKRNNPYYGYGIYYNYYHKLKPHLASKVTFRYGLTDKAEVASGVFYTFPIEYEYDYIAYYASDSTSLATSGTYVLDNNFYVPLALQMRPFRNLEISASSDFEFIHQSLDSSVKNRNNKVNIYPSRSLDYFNVQPALKVAYLYDAGKDIVRGEFNALTKRLLMGRQFLMEFKYRRDVSCLRKNGDNGVLNLIDPYDPFLYPVDYFAAGTEYSIFFAGNNSTYAGNVRPQNYDVFGANLALGLTDEINAGMGCATFQRALFTIAPCPPCMRVPTRSRATGISILSQMYAFIRTVASRAGCAMCRGT